MTLRLVSFQPASLQDVRDGHDWYEKVKAGLGKEFTGLVVQQIEELQKSFVVHRTFFENVRYTQLRKFPYAIFYVLKEEENQLIIVALLHNKQDQLTILKQRIQP